MNGRKRIQVDTPANRLRRGMTLIELMATIILTGIMAVAGTAALNTITDHRRLIEQATRETESAAATRELISSWASAATIELQMGGGPRVRGRRTVQNASGVSAAVISGDEISFNTNAVIPFGSAPTRVRLFVDDDPNTPEEGLTIEYQGAVSLPLKRMQIDSSVTLMTVEVLDGSTNRWIDTRQSGRVAPVAVRVTLGRADDKEISPMLRLPFIFRMGDEAQPVGVRR